MISDYESGRESAKKANTGRKNMTTAIKKMDSIQRKIAKAGGPFEYVRKLKKK